MSGLSRLRNYHRAPDTNRYNTDIGMEKAKSTTDLFPSNATAELPVAGHKVLQVAGRLVVCSEQWFHIWAGASPTDCISH